MGQRESSSANGGMPQVDPGPLGDIECAAALEVFLSHAAKDGRLRSSGFIAALELTDDVLFGDALFAVAASGADSIGAQDFVRFLGEVTRGAKSARLTKLLCACVGVRSFLDIATGEPAYVATSALARIFEVTWHTLISKHHATDSGFEDDDDAAVRGSSRHLMYEVQSGRRSSAATARTGLRKPFDTAPFLSSIMRAAEIEEKRELEARKDAQHVGSVATVIDRSGDHTRVDLSFVARWTNRHTPDLAEAWSGYVRMVCFADYSSIFTAPVCIEPSEILGNLGNARRAQIFCALSLAIKEARGVWKRIYGSGVDGFSFFRLCHQILGWRGPTILLIKSSCSDIFGAYLDEPWREWYAAISSAHVVSGAQARLLWWLGLLRVGPQPERSGESSLHSERNWYSRFVVHAELPPLDETSCI